MEECCKKVLGQISTWTVKCTAESSINGEKIIIVPWGLLKKKLYGYKVPSMLVREKNYMNTDTNEIWRSKDLSTIASMKPNHRKSFCEGQACQLIEK